MRRWEAGALLTMAVVLAGSAPAMAQTALVAGGLTALPETRFGANLAQNPGFETASGGLPASWSAGGGWALDQLVRRSGSFSYRWSTGSPTSSQPIFLKAGIYDFSAWVKTDGVGSGTAGIRLQLDLRPGGVNQWFTTDPIRGTADWTLYTVRSVVVPQDLQAALRLENYGGASGTAWFDDVQLAQQLPPPVSVFMLYPNYRGMLFDDQPQTMRFDVSVTPPGGDFSRVGVRGVLTDEASSQVLATQDYPASASFEAELDGSAMQAGRAYQVVLSVVDLSTGEIAYSYPPYRVSKVAASARSAMNISFDAGNRVLVRGTPRFVLGVYDSGLGYADYDAFWESTLWSDTGSRRMNGLRINFYLNYWYGQTPAGAIDALQANLQKHGVVYLQTGNCFDKYPADPGFLINSSDAYVRDIGSQPGSAGYYTIDECRPELLSGAFDQYARLRALDPDSMTFGALLPRPDSALWRDAVDVLSTDPYPMYGAEPPGGYPMYQVANGARLARQAVKNARPFMTVLQFFKFTSLGRWPTRAELRNQAYMAIVEGAHGLWWWSLGTNALASVCSDWCAERQQHMDDLEAVVGELADLEPVLLADDTPTALTGNSDPTNIQTKVKLLGGKGYLFAYNYSGAMVTPTFTWNTEPGTVTVNAESRTLATSSRSFADTFGPYQAHVYVIANGGTAGTPSPPPPGPSGLTVWFTNPQASATVSGNVTVSVSATGGDASLTYTLAVDGATVYLGTNATTTWNSTTVANGQHTLTATATDGTGKTGTATVTVNVSNPTTAPPPTGTLTVAITQPKAGATLTGTSWVVVWVEGSSGSNTFTVRLDDTTLATQTGNNGPVSISIDTTKVANGAHTLTVTVQDSTGKSGLGSIAVSTSNATTSPPPTPLSVAFLSPASGATVSGTISVTLSATGGSGGYTYGLAVDGTTVPGTGSTFSVNTTSLANGSHTFTATATDSAGATATATETVTVANTIPLAVAITQPTAGATLTGTSGVVVSVTGGTGNNTFTVRLDSTTLASQAGDNGPVSIAIDTTRVGDGSHTLAVGVVDSAGNTGSASVPVTTANTTAPPPGPLTVVISQPQAGAVVRGTTSVVVSVEGASSGSKTYTLLVDGVVIGTQVSTSSGPISMAWKTQGASGVHTITATVTDAGGNTGAASVDVTVRR